MLRIQVGMRTQTRPEVAIQSGLLNKLVGEPLLLLFGVNKVRGWYKDTIGLA